MNNASAQKLRQRALDARRQLDEEERALASSRIQHHFLNSNLFFRASKIGCYIASPLEVETSMVFDRAWRAGKRIYAPVVGRDRGMRFVETNPATRLVRNRFGLWEPESGDEILAQNLPIVITPTVAFDERNQRIGMGGGYYDRAFAGLANGNLLGVAHSCQCTKSLPTDPWDVAVTRVLTEKGAAGRL